MAIKGVKLSSSEAAALIHCRDTIACGFANGQATSILEALGERQDLEEVVIYTGLLVRPYAFLRNPAVRVVSGFFGPVDRAARAMGARIEYLPSNFRGLERLGLRLKPRVMLAVTTPPDADGYLNFGLHSEAVYRPFVQTARDPERLALVELNPHMPRILGIDEFGAHRIHISEVDAWVENDTELVALPEEKATAADCAIAEQAADLIEAGSTLQFGIGAIPDQIARLLAAGPKGDFGIHTEMVDDGVMFLHEAHKVTNHKGLYDGLSIATFALGSAALYRWLDGNEDVRMLPVSEVNDPAVTRRLRQFVSVNGALAIDLAGQVAADRIAARQHSGVGGHESFVIGAMEATGGKSLLCMKSTAIVDGKRLSTIVSRLPECSTVTTPRHHVQYVVTEHGAADLSTLGDIERRRVLISLAHPDFRAELEALPH